MCDRRFFLDPHVSVISHGVRFYTSHGGVIDYGVSFLNRVSGPMVWCCAPRSLGFVALRRRTTRGPVRSAPSGFPSPAARSASKVAATPHHRT